MPVFFGVVFLVYGGMHLYACSRIWQAFPHSTALAISLAAFGVLLTFSPFLLFYAAHRHWHDAVAVLSWPVYVWMGLIFLFFSIGLALDVARAAATLLGSTWLPGAQAMLFASATLALAGAVYGFFDARNIRIERITVTTSKPLQGSITIAQLSDLHLGAMLGDELLVRVLEKLRETKPDVIVATGDIVDGQGDHLDVLAQRLRACNAPKGKFAVLGNHEYYVGIDDAQRFLEDAGFVILRGEAVATGGIIIAGVDDPAGLALGKATRLHAIVPAEKNFIVLLKHQPTVDPDDRFDLQLSGHVHGGQIFPFNYLTWLHYRVDAGLTQLARHRWLYVSRGTGTWGPPIRLFATPEITLITLRAE